MPPVRTHDRGNFDLIRLAAAGAVVVSHAFLLSRPLSAGGRPTGLDPLEAIDGARFSLGSLAVDVFFVLSGYLVAQSWLADRRPAAYLARRGLRIMPALAVTVLLSAAVVGPLLSTLPIGEYATAPATRGYLGNVLLFHNQATLPGVFQGNTWHPDVNGSLWTLRYEASWYLVIPLVCAAGAGMARRLAPALLAAALTAVAVMPLGTGRPLPLELDLSLVLVLGCFALAGMVLYLFRDAVPMRGWLALLLLALWVATWRTPLLNVTAVLAFGYSAVYAATRKPPLGGRLQPAADISYGVYLYGFLAEQIADWALGSHATPLFVLLLGGALAVGVAMLSWAWVEAPALRLKSRLLSRARAAVNPQRSVSTAA